MPYHSRPGDAVPGSDAHALLQNRRSAAKRRRTSGAVVLPPGNGSGVHGKSSAGGGSGAGEPHADTDEVLNDARTLMPETGARPVR